MTLTQEQMNQALEDAPPVNAGEVDFGCPNCEKEHHETIWMEAMEVDDEGELTYDFPHATKICSCGASILIAWQPDGEGELYWLNKKKMQTCSDTPTEGEQ